MRPKWCVGGVASPKAMVEWIATPWQARLAMTKRAFSLPARLDGLALGVSGGSASTSKTTAAQSAKAVGL